VLVNAIRPTVEGARWTFLQSSSSAEAFYFSPTWDRLIRVWFVFAAGVLLLAVVAKLQWIFSNPFTAPDPFAAPDPFTAPAPFTALPPKLNGDKALTRPSRHGQG
jgi:hypothetical protein